MIVLRIALALAALALAGLIVWGSSAAPIADSFAAISADPWGIVTIADLYVGFVVASVVIAAVERPAIAVILIVALLALGNVVSALWLAVRAPKILAALRQAR